MIGGFILSGNIVNAVDRFSFTAAAICNKGTTADRAPCGTTCIDSCNNLSQVVGFNGDPITVTLSASQREICRGKARAASSWAQHSINGRITVTYSWGIGRIIDIDFDFVSVASVCSIADKCYGNTCANPRSPYLRAGRCECGEVGGRYKICCRREGNRYVEVAAIRATGEDDGHPPEEGMCPGGWAAPPNVTQCPAPIPTPVVPVPVPEFRIDSFLANPTTITPGQFTTLTWATTGATDCRITRTGGAGLGNVPPDGSGQSNPPETTTYTLNCGRISALTDRRMAHVTVTVVAPNALLAPTVSCSTISSTQINISWTNEANETGYRIYRCAGTGCTPTTSVHSVGPNVISWQNTGLIADTIYRYRVRAFNAAGSSPFSNTVECRTSAPLPPPPVVTAPPGCVAGPRAVTADIGVTHPCLPLHETRGGDMNPVPLREMTTSTNINWRGTSRDVCEKIISGTGADRHNIVCSNTTNNWSLNRSGSGTIFGTVLVSPEITQDYRITCTRESFRCISERRYSSGLFGRHICENSCFHLRQRNSNVGDCTCIARRCSPLGGCTFYQRIESRQICPSSHSDLQQIRVIQKPRTDDNSLVTDPVRPQILLNHFINLVWRINRPDSSVPTTMMCTPSVASGDGEGWTGALDSLAPSGRRDNLSPNVTTFYQLFCRNRDAVDPNRCFNDSDIVSREVRVFTPDLREIPAFYDGFMRLVGRIGDVLR